MCTHRRYNSCMSTCAYEDCPRRVDYAIEGVRWCGMHGRRIRKNGSPDVVRKVQSYAGAECSADGCANKARRNGLCDPCSRQDRMRRDHPLHPTWRGMKERCENPNHAAYDNYGGRGIKVCPEWHDFAVFAAYVEQHLGPRPDGMTIDRWPDGDGDYRPGNVRWATRAEQQRNRKYRRDSYPGLSRARG